MGAKLGKIRFGTALWNKNKRLKRRLLEDLPKRNLSSSSGYQATKKDKAQSEESVANPEHSGQSEP